MYGASALRNGKPPRVRGWVLARVGLRVRSVVRYARLVTHTLTLHAAIGEESPALEHFSLTGGTVVARGREVVVSTRRGERLRVRPQKEVHFEHWLDGFRAASFVLERFYAVDEDRVLGKGAFSQVFYGGDRETGDYVAVKVMDKKECGEVEREHARCEARLLSFMRHANVVECFDLFDTEDNLCVVMRWMAGGTLEENLGRVRGAREERWAVVGIIISNMLAALAYMHENGVVHRDVKVENVLMSAERDLTAWARSAVISDFGLAAYVQNGEELDKVVGTYHYLAPEVLTRGEDGGFVGYGPEVDVWAAGCVLHWLITAGELPLEGAVREMVGKDGDVEDPTMVCRAVRAVAEDGMDFSGEKWADIPPAALSLLKGMLAPVPGKRLTAFGALAHPFLDGVPKVFPGPGDDAGDSAPIREKSADEDVADMAALASLPSIGEPRIGSEVRLRPPVRPPVREDGGLVPSACILRPPAVARWQRAVTVAIALVRFQDTLRPKARRRRVRFGLPANQRAENRVTRSRMDIEPAPIGVDGMRYNVGLIPFPRRPVAPDRERTSISSNGSFGSGSYSAPSRTASVGSEVSGHSAQKPALRPSPTACASPITPRSRSADSSSSGPAAGGKPRRDRSRLRRAVGVPATSRDAAGKAKVAAAAEKADVSPAGKGKVPAAAPSPDVKRGAMWGVDFGALVGTRKAKSTLEGPRHGLVATDSGAGS